MYQKKDDSSGLAPKRAKKWEIYKDLWLLANLEHFLLYSGELTCELAASKIADCMFEGEKFLELKTEATFN